uniref:CUE domain-containing protein n=1 Tax=Salix viminalis TaxID=40686 RepID=A0A6N2NEX4_SALVM
MSAIVCGKRSFFEELTVTSPPVSKRIRCSSSSPVRFSPPRSNTPASNPPSINFGSSSSSSSTLSEQLAAIFPDMDKQKVLEECGDDLDSAIRSLNDLRLGSAENFSAATDKSGVIDESNAPAQGVATTDAEAPPTEGLSAPAHLSLDGAEWVELFVREMMSASNIDDARALSIQHERQKEYEERNQELQQLKQLVSQYQDQLRTLEVNNYALTLHLKQAQQSSSIPGRFHPDVF